MLLLVLFVVNGQSQNLYLERTILSEQIAGSRAAAMGGAFTALAEDATALAWNPAGLSQSSRFGVVATGTIYFTNVSVTLPTTLSSQKYRIDSEGTFDMHFVGICLPIKRKQPNVVAAISLQNLVPLQDRTLIVLKDLKAGWSNVSEMQRDGNLYALNAGIAMNVLPGLSFGVTFAALFGRQQTDSTNTYEWDTFERSSYFRQKNDFSGNLVRLGLLWQAHQQFTLGSCITLPHRIKLTQRQAGDPVASTMSDSTNISLSKPIRLTAGACWRLSKDFLLTFDYHYQPWQEAFLSQSQRTIYSHFANAHSFHMGSEFTYETSYYTFAWRLGFFTHPEQLFEAEEDRRGDQITSHFYTTGLGIQTKYFAFDLSLSYQNLQYKAPTLVEDADLADISENNYRVHFGMQIYF
ncbi:hypothetical protein JXO59_02040 [candidate division KSB1 bacterium]|nr:hypothetical protein [candidate division KSB1 bacterium]